MCKKLLVLTKSCWSRTDGPALVVNTEPEYFVSTLASERVKSWYGYQNLSDAGSLLHYSMKMKVLSIVLN